MSEVTPIGGKPVDPDDPRSRVQWRGRWLRDPVFQGVEYRQLIHPGRSEELNGEIRNVHTLFRRQWGLDDRPIRRATLYLTADDCYKLYVNGQFIGLGPAPAYPFDYPYNAWDVGDRLVPGEPNCIGVHAFYQGMHSLTFPSGDNLAGLVVQLEIEFADGCGAMIVTDDQWRCVRTEAYESRQVLGYQTAFSEHIDLRKLPVGWSEVGYDDRSWVHPLVGEVPEHYTFSPQRTPPVSVRRRSPRQVVKKGDGHYFIDFGTELAGETAFIVTGPAGHEVECRHGEELEAPGTVRYDMRCNCTYQEFCTLSGRPNELLTFFDYKGFRYAEVLCWPEELTADRVWAHERHYPFDEDASAFGSSHPLLNDVWALCKNGVRVGTLDTYLDCPTREKGGFLGDGFVTGLSHLTATGDGRVLRKFLKDVANTQRYSPGLLSTAPNYVNGELAEYSLLWPVLLEYYYLWTADLGFVKEMTPVLAGQLRYFAGYENADGLLQDLYAHATGRYSVLVDWPKNLRDDYDDPYLMGDRSIADPPSGVVNTMVQGFYGNALRAAERLARIADDHGISEHVAGRADRLRDAVLSHLRDPSTGLFIDRNGSTHSALHANVTPLMAGMLDPNDRSPALNLIRNRRLSCGVYFSWFVLKTLYSVGESDLAYDLMTSRDLHSWHSMLEAGASTCMEAWAPDLKWNTSWCHPWSSAPVYMLAHELMGLRPGAPGWQTIQFAPRPPRGLGSAAIRLTTPRGPVEAAYERGDDRITYRLTVPDDCPVICHFDSSVQQVLIAGQPQACRTEIDGFGLPRLVMNEPLRGAEHTLITTLSSHG